jgi:hypothetical protein
MGQISHVGLTYITLFKPFEDNNESYYLRVSSNRVLLCSGIFRINIENRVE